VPKIVYVLTNPAMPDLVKIGVTARNEIRKRITELSHSTGVPLPFQCYYAGEVTKHSENVEHLIHDLFKKYRVSSGKEFFTIDPDEAVIALKLASAKDVTPQLQMKHKPEEVKAIKKVERRRRNKTVLRDLGIHPGATLTLSKGHNLKSKVVQDNKVRYGNKDMSLSEAAVEALGKLDYKTRSAAGTHYWMFKGKTIGQIRKEKDQKQSN